LRWRLTGILGKALVDLLFRTTRIETVGEEPVRELLNSRRFIAAFWHSRILLVSYLYQGWNAAILVSQSEDGEIIAQVLQRQGHETIRGSSTRGGGRALAGMIRRIRETARPAAIIPDGPQGPRFKVQPGVITLARKTGYPIIPMTYSAAAMKVFGSWDRFILPYPFTTCRLAYGPPLCVPTDANREAERHLAGRLEAELCRITAEADGYFGHRRL
ncbi:MAG: lysophospholipid acyltransferase family protein, partial [Desulfobacterales bacterium]|nr:lysophospholipid acyltransferase family protein [Desulfobacterales bacterium]